MKLTKMDMVWCGLALAAGLITGWIDFHATEVLPAVACVLLFGGLLGLGRPGKAWLWAVILATALPVFYLVSMALGFSPADGPQPGIYALFIVVIPALIGAYGGALARWAWDSLRKPA